MRKNRGKLNIVDFVVLLVILVVVGYAVYAMAARVEDNGGSADIQYVICADELRSGFSDKLTVGDPVYNRAGDFMGSVVSVSASPAYFEGVDSNGNAVNSTIEGYETAYITVSCNASVRKWGYEMNGETVAAGESYQLRTPSLWFEGQCVSVEKTQS